MPQEKEVKGCIDCPSCGTAHGMRITLDKNGDPFGFCEAECNQQLRIGGNPRRVALFLARYPWASNKPEPEAKPAPVEKKAAEPVPVPIQEKPPRPAPPKRGVFGFGL